MNYSNFHTITNTDTNQRNFVQFIVIKALCTLLAERSIAGGEFVYSASELAERLDITLSTASRTLNKLVEMGFVLRSEKRVKNHFIYTVLDNFIIGDEC